MSKEKYSTIVVGTGFASSFFLMEYLKHIGEHDRVLVIEKGEDIPYSVKLKNRKPGNVRFDRHFNNLTPQKGWVQNIAFGGGSCWTGNTPRMHPSDFKLRTLHGIGEDWPFDYDVFEPYMAEVENIMKIAGQESAEYPRSSPYPLKAHKLNALDLLLAKKYGDKYLPMPSARSSDSSSGRPQCCNNGVCSVCPIGAKFQVDLHMRSVYDDPRVVLKTESEVLSFCIQNDTVKSVLCREGVRQVEYSADLFAIGAHAIATPFILLNSGLADYALGRYLNEQISLDIRVNFLGLQNFGGGQQVTGVGAMFVNEESRSTRSGCLVENWNLPWLRAEFGKWRSVGHLKLVMDDIPSPGNQVTVGDNGKPDVSYKGYSDYMKRGLEEAPKRVEALLHDLPVEDYHIEEVNNNRLGGSAHIQGTTKMGLDSSSSVTDASLIHHKVRNLAVLGSGTFPTCQAANPTLLLSALSIMCARKLMR